MRFIAAMLISGLCAAGAGAQTSYPMLTHAHPVAVQCGATAEVQVDCQMSLFGAYQVLVEGAGVTVEVLPANASKADPSARPQVRSVKLKFTVAPEAPLGVREFRIATSLGVSSVGQILVCDHAVVQETANNNTPDQATHSSCRVWPAARSKPWKMSTTISFTPRPGKC